MISDQLFEQVEKQLENKLPFVAYRKPNSSEIKTMLQVDSALNTISDFTESGFVFAPFDSGETAFLIPLKQAKLHVVKYDPNNFAENEVGFNTEHSNRDNATQDRDKRLHIKRVESGIEAINNDIFSKVVLSRREIIEDVQTNPLAIFKRLLRRYPTAFVYVWYHPEVGLWLGATPETLLSVNGNQLKTMALAGTQAFEGEMDVVWKEKEKEEQQIVTDFIVESLESVINPSKVKRRVQADHHSTLTDPLNVLGPEKTIKGRLSVDNKKMVSDRIKVSITNTVKAGNLLHLLTEITMQLTPETRILKPILEVLHPTPAVCGFPKEKAKSYIIENEGYPREFYAGFMGELNLNETIRRNKNRRNVENNAYRARKVISNLYVNLRCMQIKDQDVFVYVGGGITKDSNPMAEWEETVNKTKTIKSVL